MRLFPIRPARYLALPALCALAAIELVPRPALAISAPDARAVCRAPGGIIVARSENAAACNRVGAGAYEVIIGNNVTGCTFVATLSGAAGEISVAQGGANNRVRVQTRDSAGGAANRAFHLVVAC